MTRPFKESGIEWVGAIPQEWRVYPARYAFSEVKQKNTDGSVQKALQFKFGTIVPKQNFDADSDEYVADTITTYTVVRPGVVMINGLNLNYDFVTQRTALVRETGAITSAYLALQPDERKILPEYATYLFKGYETRMALHNMGTGIRLTLGFKEFKHQPVLFPSIEEQQRIVDYLNRRCYEIDQIKAETEKTIEEYKALKQSMITDAVIHGCRGSRPMKQSGVEWIGVIPEEWDIRVAFQLFDQVKNKNQGLIEQNLLSLSYGKIKRKAIDTVGGLLPESFDGYNIIEADDIVLRLTDLQNDHTSLRVGLSTERGIVTSAYLTLRNRSKNLPLYLYYYLHTYDVYKGFYGMGGGVRQGLNWDGLKLLKIVIPPIEEQREIISYAEKISAEIEKLIAEKQRLLIELDTYRKTVIYEYVTGKKEV